MSNCMDIEKFKIMMNTCIISQFSYCPLAWMFHVLGVFAYPVVCVMSAR